MVSEDPRFGKQARWMQSGVLALEARVRQLEQELASARRLLNNGPEDANVIVDPYGENRQPMFDRPTVAFQFRREGEKFERYFLVRLMESNRLEVHASAGIAIHPSTNNAVKIEVLDR